MNLFHYFREATERKLKGHVLIAYCDTPRRVVGWIDLTDNGFSMEAGLFSEIKPQFSDLSRLPRGMIIAGGAQEANAECRASPWETLGITWQGAREIIQTSEGRGRYFGRGREDESATG